MGYTYEAVEDGGQRGICAMPDGERCDAWAFLQGTCGQAHSYCARQGYGTATRSDGQNPFSVEYAVCLAADGAVVGSVTELSALSEKATGCGGELRADETTLNPPPGAETYEPGPVGAPPSSFDWRDHQGYDWLTPIRNQGGCGSCWAFAAVGIAEAVHNIANHDPSLDKDISEQYLVSDCDTYSGDCCGGWHDSALQYLRDDGVPDDDCMTYVDGWGCGCDGGACTDCAYSCSDRTCDDRCADWSSRLEYISGMGTVSSDQQAIKQALVDHGPLAVAMGIGSAYSGGWDGDIYRCGNDSGVNHAVVIVGYDDAGGYWWVRNSWGSGWNGDGYFKVGYGECSVENYVRYANVEACWADFNDDGVVDGQDVDVMTGSWRDPATPPHDVDGDGLLTVVDVTRVTAEWGACP
jgi:putative hemolysin